MNEWTERRTDTDDIEGVLGRYVRECGCRLLEARQIDHPGRPWYGVVYDSDALLGSPHNATSPYPGFRSAEEAMRWAEDALRQECEDTLKALDGNQV